MDLKNFLFYFNYALKIILAILLIYLVYVGWVFFSAIGDDFSSEDFVVSQCNSYVNLQRYNEYCCVERSVILAKILWEAVREGKSFNCEKWLVNYQNQLSKLNDDISKTIAKDIQELLAQVFT